MKNLTPLSMIDVTWRPYAVAHGRDPRGQGNWCFRIRMPGNDVAPAYWRADAFWFNGLYSDARRAAVNFAHRIGGNGVEVQS